MRHSQSLSRHVATGRCLSPHPVAARFYFSRRDRLSRQVGACRGLSDLFNVRDVLVHRCRRDKVFFAELGLDEAALEVAFGAIALNTARSAGETSASVALQGLVDRQGEIAVVGCRDKSRLVVGHRGMITAIVPRLRRLSPYCREIR